MKRLSLIIFALIMALSLPSMANAQQSVADSLTSLLKLYKTPEDSLKMLYDIYDASDFKHKSKVGVKIVDLAKRTDDQRALAEFIPQVVSVSIKDTTVVKDMLDYTRFVRNPEDNKMINLFIQVKKAAEEANYIPEDELRKVLLDYAKEDMTDKDDFYENVLDVYRMLIFIGNRSKGNLYLEYLTRLESMIEQLPDNMGYIQNQFYTTAANVHTRNGNHEKALEMDRKLLSIIANLEKTYKELGRPYRDYSRYKYISYRRMLSNYQALSMDEIKDLYAKCSRLAEENPDIAADFYAEGRPTIYRLMAEGDYVSVVPKIKKALKIARDRYAQGSMLRMLVAAADSINDKETLLSALKDYSHYLKTTLDAQSEEAYQELQIRYDINRLKTEKEDLEHQKKNAELASNQRVITVALVGVLVLAIALMFLYRSNFSLKRRMRDTKEENQHLRQSLEEMFGNTGLKRTLNVRQESPGKKK